MKNYNKRMDIFVEEENRKTDPELIVDNYGASMMEV